VAEFIWPVRVYYEDTDSGGVVYYANYLKFMERARTEWLRTRGYEQDVLVERENLIFVVRSVQLDFLQPARFNEQLAVSVVVSACRGASIEFQQEVRRESTVLCSASVKIACLNSDSLKPQRLPSAMIEELVE